MGARRREGEVGPLAFLAAAQKPSINEKLHVVTDRALRQVRIRREVANAGAIHALRSGDLEQEIKSRLVAEGFE